MSLRGLTDGVTREVEESIEEVFDIDGVSVGAGPAGTAEAAQAG